jgi:predicted nucleotidyltransferase component of viral defense system
MVSSSELTALQKEVLARFFKHERGFFLTGGAALVGYYLHHRSTSDLDLFTLDRDAFERGPFVVQQVAEELESAVEVRQDAPGFKRFALTRLGEGVVVDLVHEKARQLAPEKLTIEGVVVDPREEILANKLTALVGRMEERDLVDVYFLERAGLCVEDHLDAALAKDAGATPATLAWLLSEIHIPDGAKLPARVTPSELREYVAGLIKRLRLRAFPAAGG